mgnify:CR=1 FL=1
MGAAAGRCAHHHIHLVSLPDRDRPKGLVRLMHEPCTESQLDAAEDRYWRHHPVKWTRPDTKPCPYNWATQKQKENDA